MTIETTYELYELYNGATGREQVEIGTFDTLDAVLAKITPQSERQALKKVFGIGSTATRFIYHVVNKTSGWTMHKYFVKVVETLNYDQPQPLVDAQQEAKDKYFNQLAAEIRELEQAARAERKSSRKPQPAPVDTKAIQSIHTRSGSTELAIQTFIDELKALDSDALKVQGALLNLEDALGHFQAARHSLGIYLRDTTQDSERVTNAPAPAVDYEAILQAAWDADNLHSTPETRDALQKAWDNAQDAMEAKRRKAYEDHDIPNLNKYRQICDFMDDKEAESMAICANCGHVIRHGEKFHIDFNNFDIWTHVQCTNGSAE